jgi:glutathione synthase/RimK-type ligase-like ATP-grasp enzyme
VILTQEMDVTADCVVKKLYDRGVPVFRYDTSYFPVNSAITFKDTDTGWQTNLMDSTYGERFVALEEASAVWYRRPTLFRIDDEVTGPYREFAMRECVHGFGGIMAALPVLWVNRPDAEARADFKPFQLRVAKRIGLTIPRTLITNNPGDVGQFFDECQGSVIYKALNSGLVREPGGWPGGLLTTAITMPSDELLQRVRFAPCIFQQRVDKAYDLRVTVIGDSIVPVRIDRRDDTGRPVVDWRDYPDESNPLRHSRVELPAEVESGLRRLMAELGLVYGAVDMVVTPAGEHVFLEVNPSGQFAWLDDEIEGLGLVEAMADLLVAGHAGLKRR